LQALDDLDAAPDDEHVEGPEEEEADPDAGGVGGGGGPEDLGHRPDGLATDPALDAEPAAGDEGSEDGGHVGAEDAEAGSDVDGERDAVLGSSVGVEDHRDEDDEVAEEDGEDGLLPAHAACDEAAGEHVGGDADGHGDPEGGVVVEAPGAVFAGDGGEVFVPESVADVGGSGDGREDHRARVGPLSDDSFVDLWLSEVYRLEQTQERRPTRAAVTS